MEVLFSFLIRHLNEIIYWLADGWCLTWEDIDGVCAVDARLVNEGNGSNLAGVLLADALRANASSCFNLILISVVGWLAVESFSPQILATDYSKTSRHFTPTLCLSFHHFKKLNRNHLDRMSVIILENPELFKML